MRLSVGVISLIGACLTNPFLSNEEQISIQEVVAKKSTQTSASVRHRKLFDEDGTLTVNDDFSSAHVTLNAVPTHPVPQTFIAYFRILYLHPLLSHAICPAATLSVELPT